MARKKELVSKLTVKCIFYTTTSLAIYFPYMVENDEDAYRLKTSTKFVQKLRELNKGKHMY